MFYFVAGKLIFSSDLSHSVRINDGSVGDVFMINLMCLRDTFALNAWNTSITSWSIYTLRSPLISRIEIFWCAFQEFHESFLARSESDIQREVNTKMSGVPIQLLFDRIASPGKNMPDERSQIANPIPINTPIRRSVKRIAAMVIIKGRNCSRPCLYTTYDHGRSGQAIPVRIRITPNTQYGMYFTREAANTTAS